MRSRLWIAALVVSLGVNIGFLLHWAWPRIATAPTGWHAGAMRRHLGLSPEQAKRMEEWRQQVLAEAGPLQEELRGKRRDLFNLLKGGEAREADLDPLLGEIARLQAAIEKAFVRHGLKVRSVFSPEQLRKYEGCLEKGLCSGMMGAARWLPGQPAAAGAARGCAGAGGKQCN